MKHSTIFITRLVVAVVVVLLVTAMSTTAWGQLVTSENFNFTDNALLTANGWTAHSSGGTNAIDVGASNGLTYTGYSGVSGITGAVVGNAARVDNTGEDDSKTFTAVTSGTLYWSFLVNFPSAAGAAGYFTHLGGSATTFDARVFVQPSSTSGKINFGFSNTSTGTFSLTDFDPGTTYLVIVKSNVDVTGAGSLWVVASGVPATEAAAGTALLTTTGSGLASIDRVCLRQYSATQSQIVDGIRVATSWAALLPAPASSSSDIIAAGNETANINYALYQASTFADSTNGARVWSFTIRDGGGSADADAFPTILSSITIDKGTSNGVTNWASTIREAALFNGPNKIAEVSVTGESITFSGLSGANVTAPDDGATTLSLYLTFETAATDNLQYQFQVTNANVTAGLSSSGFSAFSTQSSSTTGDADRVEVVASKLAFSTNPPGSLAANVAFSSAVQARDVNDNVDLDFVAPIALSVNTGTGILSAVSGLSKAATSGTSSWSDLKYNTAETGVSIKASSSGLTDGISSSFNVNSNSALSKIVAGVLTIPTTISSLVNTQPAEVAVFDFTIQDGGGSPDADAQPTIINSLTVVPGSSNNIADWSTYIQRAELYESALFLDSAIVSATGLTFIGSPVTSVPDDGNKTLTMKMYLKAPLPVGADGKLFQFQVNQNTNVTTDPGGSLMAAGGSTVVGGSGTAIDVLATQLQFVGTIPNTGKSTNFAATAKATDANNNTDKDFTAAVTFAKASGPGNLTGTTGPSAVAGVATTSNLQFDAGGTYTLSAAATGLTGATSNSFIITAPAYFKVAAGASKLYWDNPSTWVIVRGVSATGTPQGLDTVTLDHQFHAGMYIVSTGFDTTQTGAKFDSAAQITVGVIGDTDPSTVELMVPHNAPTSPSGSVINSLKFGDGVVGNYDLIVQGNGRVSNYKDNFARSMAFRSLSDSMWIRTGGYFYWNTRGFNTVHRVLSRRFDGDYGTIELDLNAATTGTFDISGGVNYFYPNLVLSNTGGFSAGAGPGTYFWFGTGVTTIKGNLTINAGAKDSIMLTGYAFRHYGNIINNGTVISTANCPIVFAGSTTQTVSGSNVMSLGGGVVMANAAGVNLLKDVNITGGTVLTTGTLAYDSLGTGVTPFPVFTCAGALNTGSNTMFVNPAGGTLNEGANPVQGNVSATRTVGTTLETFGSMGFEMTPALAPGVTTVLRKTGTGSISHGNSHSSIARYYDVTPTVNSALNASIGVSYATTELNGITESRLLLEKSTDVGVTWSGKAGSVNTGLHKITATGVGSFSRWTAASADSPLFITHTITLRKLADNDGNINTTGDQSAKKWGLTLYKDSVAGTPVNTGNPINGVLVTPNLEAGTYIAVENDSTSIGWIALGKIHHGVKVAGTTRFDTLVVSGGVADSTDFINQKVAGVAIYKFKDTDGNPSTFESPKKWHLTLYNGSVAPGNIIAQADTSLLFVSGLQAGTYIAVEADSGAPWVRLNGNHTRYDTLTISAGVFAADTFSNFRPNNLSVTKVKDNDGLFSTSGDRSLKTWHLEVHQNTAGGPLVHATNTGADTLLGVGDGTYVLVEADSAGWVHLGYTVGVVPTASGANNVSVSVVNGQTANVTFVNAPPIYSQTFRSFSANNIPLDVDNKGKPGKFVKRVPDKSQFSMGIMCDSVNITDLHIEFGAVVDTAFALSTIPPSTHSTSDSKLKKWDFVFASPINTGDSVHIFGFAWDKKGQKVSKYWWTRSSVVIGKSSKIAVFTNQQRLPMPNRINALYEVMTLDPTFSTNGLVVGKNYKTPVDSSKLYGWFQTAKYGDILKTLHDKTGFHGPNTGRPFDLFTSNSHPLIKQQKTLPPSKQNNSLLANMIALKLNIAASAMRKIPLGFGELLYNAGGSDPFNNMMLKEIAHLGDSVMEGYYVGTTHTFPAFNYVQLDTTIGKINAAFEGALDTLYFSDSLVFKGTTTLLSVPFLHANPNVVPATIVSLAAKPSQEVPEAYTLYQNYPNPFNPTTTIEFDLADPAVVTLKVYNILGQEVATLLNNEVMDVGVQSVDFNASNFASGVYFYRLVTSSVTDPTDEATTSATRTFTSVKKMLLVK